MNIAPLKEKYADRLRDHEVARQHLILPVGGVADYYLEVVSIDELIDSVSYCQKNDIQFRVIGAGTTILISDYGYPGLIIKNLADSISIIPGTSKVIVDSGVLLSRLMIHLANNNIGGLEFLHGEKGTVGGAIYNNNPINKYLKKLTILSPRSEALARSATWLQSGNCSTKIKNQLKKNIILTAIFQFYQSRQEDIVRKINEVKKPRRWEYIISGNIFSSNNIESANDIIKRAKINKIKEKNITLNPDSPNHLMLKHSNVSANDVRVYIEKLRQAIFENTNIMLIENIEYLGQW